MAITEPSVNMAGFQVGPSQRDPQAFRNPILDEIDNAAKNAHATLSPQAQAALTKAGAPIPGQAAAPGAPQPTITSPRPAAPSIAPVPQPPTQPGNAAELARLTAPPPGNPALTHTKENTGTAGVNQIHSPWARIPLQIASGLAETFAPRLAAALPGTESHHQMLVGEREGALKQDELQRESEEKARLGAANQHHLEAEALNQESLPELHQAQSEAAAAKQSESSEHNRAMEAIGQTKADSGRAAVANKLRIAGYDPETGEPLPYEQLSEQQQAIHDWKAAQSEQAEATAALRQAQAKNEPAKVAIAQQRIQGANNARSIAERRLNLSEAQFEMRSRGTQGGEALPGAIETDQGAPVGTAFQQNVRPTGQERNKADLANSAHLQITEMKSIVQNRPDIFGPAAGRKTDFNVWVGSQDPDAQRFRAARTIAGDHLAGVFGGRSEAALSALDAAIGHFKDNPQAVLAGLDQLDQANAGFIKAGTPKTVGSDRVANQNVDPQVKAYADKYFGGDVGKAQAAIAQQQGGKK